MINLKYVFCSLLIFILISHCPKLMAQISVKLEAPKKIDVIDIKKDSSPVKIYSKKDIPFVRVEWFVDGKNVETDKGDGSDTIAYFNSKLKGGIKGREHKIKAKFFYKDKDESVLKIVKEKKIVVYKEYPHKKFAGIFYFPNKKSEREVRRMYRGNWGMRQGFNLVLTSIVAGGDRKGNTKFVWKKYLPVLKKVTNGKLKAVLDVHVMRTNYWLYEKGKNKKPRLFNLLCKIMKSKYSDCIAGWYLCDEPFAKVRPGKPPRADFKRIFDLANIIRSAQKSVGKRYKIFADYGSVQAVMKRDGGYTKKWRKREKFFFNEKWVYWVVDKKYNNGKPICRRYGIFGEDVTMINFYGGAESLRKKWIKYMISDVPAKKINLVIGYDWSPNKPKSNNAILCRVKNIIKVGEKYGVGGYWLWPWSKIRIGSQGKTYKGASCWWENDHKDKKYPKRYANAIESIP